MQVDSRTELVVAADIANRLGLSRARVSVLTKRSHALMQLDRTIRIGSPCRLFNCAEWGGQQDPEWKPASSATIADRVGATATDRFVKKHFDACLNGAVVGAFTGPQDAAIGCGIAVLTELGEQSKSRKVRIAAYIYDASGFVDDVPKVERYYERIELLLEHLAGRK